MVKLNEGFRSIHLNISEINLHVSSFRIGPNVGHLLERHYPSRLAILKLLLAGDSI